MPSEVQTIPQAYLNELHSDMRSCVISICVFSFFSNALLLAGPLYMLQIYDRVLTSDSFETLVGLTLITFFLLAIWGVLDFCRARILARLGATLRVRLDCDLGSVLGNPKDRFRKNRASELISHVDRVATPFSTSAAAALADVIWVPIFLAGLAVFHPLLCGFASLALCVLVALNRLAASLGQVPQCEATQSASLADVVARKASMATTWASFSLQNNIWRYWREVRLRTLDLRVGGSDSAGAFASMSRSWRLMMQSGMLGIGAALVLIEALTPGAMVAATVLLSRAVGPVDVLSLQWGTLLDAKRSWRKLRSTLPRVTARETEFALRKPGAGVKVKEVMVPCNHGRGMGPFSFDLEPGMVLSILGSPGSGKGDLIETIAGLNRRQGGQIWHGSVELPLSPTKSQTQHCGFLSKNPPLFPGTIAQNIAGFETSAAQSGIIRAAEATGIASDIRALPEGYFTDVTEATSKLPAGASTMIALAQLVYDMPEIFVLDDPFSQLSPKYARALTALIEQRKRAAKTTIFTTRTPAALELCDRLLWLENGICRAFGPKDAVLTKYLAPPLPTRGHLGLVS